MQSTLTTSARNEIFLRILREELIPAFGCTENIGRALRQLCVERLAEKFRLLKNDEDCVRMVLGLPPVQK